MQHTLQLGDQQLNYSIHYRNRKSVGITVSREEGVRVLTPRWVGLKQIEGILREKSGWILRKQAEVLEKSPGAGLESGIQLPLAGECLTLTILKRDGLAAPHVQRNGQEITLLVPERMPEEAGKQALIQWYRQQAVGLIRSRVEVFSRIMGVTPSRVVVKQQKSRWGSCSSKGNVNLNWRLVMMPPEVLDYVVVHELAHLKVLNHSKGFWDLVGSVLEDYPQRRKRLKELEKKLVF